MNGPRIDSDWTLTSDEIGMKLFGADTNSGVIQKISDWFGLNFNPKLSPGIQLEFFLIVYLNVKNFSIIVRVQIELL